MKPYRDAERVLVAASGSSRTSRAGGAGGLTPRELEGKCLARLTRLLMDLVRWPRTADGPGWRIGDFRVLIVETTVAPDAVLYVQFWSEPEQPLLWEVSSGFLNKAARPFVKSQARRTLADMGFRPRGSARNFGKTVTISNSGDAAAVGRDVLCILHDAFNYRGRTALVARTMASGRSDRAVVHAALTPEDIVALLRRFGYRADLQEKQPRTTIFAERDGFRFAVTAELADDYGAYRCVDLAAIVGRITTATAADWTAAMNRLNGCSRVARGWIDPDGNLLVGTSFCLRGGLTEAYLADQVDAWRHAAEQLVGGPVAVEDRDEPTREEPVERARKAVLH